MCHHPQPFTYYSFSALMQPELSVPGSSKSNTENLVLSFWRTLLIEIQGNGVMTDVLQMFVIFKQNYCNPFFYKPVITIKEVPYFWDFGTQIYPYISRINLSSDCGKNSNKTLTLNNTGQRRGKQNECTVYSVLVMELMTIRCVNCRWDTGAGAWRIVGNVVQRKTQGETEGTVTL